MSAPNRYRPWGPVLSSASGAPRRWPPAGRWCVRLPVKAVDRFFVLVDGVPQVPVIDYEVLDRYVVFAQLPAGRRHGLLRRRGAATVEIRYELDGHRLVAQGLVPEPL